MRREMHRKIFAAVTLIAAVVCLVVFAWANGAAVNANTIRVDNEEDLRAAVLSYDYSIIEISKDAKINMGTTSLSIPADRTVTLSLDLGSSLDFSSSGQQIEGKQYVGINNIGHLTIAGSGDIVMSKDKAFLIYCNDGSNLDVTGGTLTAKTCNNRVAYAIITASIGTATSITVKNSTINTSAGSTNSAIMAYIGNVTVTNSTLNSNGSEAVPIQASGGNVTIGNKSTISGSGNYVIYYAVSNTDYHLTVTDSTVTGGVERTIYACKGTVILTNSVISADVGGYAICPGQAEWGSHGAVTVLSCDCKGGLSVDTVYSKIDIHSGKFTVSPEAYKAPGCTVDDSGTNYTVSNCASLALDGGVTTSGDEYTCTVDDTTHVIAISADLRSGDTYALTSLDAIDKAALPKSLEVTTSPSAKTITVSNNGCETGTYKTTIWAGNTINNQAFRVLNITVGTTPTPDPEEISVTSAASLDAALKSSVTQKITLNNGITGFASFDTLGCAKSFDLGTHTLTLTKSADVNQNLVIYGGTISGDTATIGAIFGKITSGEVTLSADLKINGKPFADNGGFTSTNVTITNGVKFSDDTNVAPLLQDDQYITSYKDNEGYYEVRPLNELQTVTTSRDLKEALLQTKLNTVKISDGVTSSIELGNVTVNGDPANWKTLDLNGKSLDQTNITIAPNTKFKITNGGQISTNNGPLFTLGSGAQLSLEQGYFKRSDNSNYFANNGGTITIADGVKFYGTEKPTDVETLLQTQGKMLKQCEEPDTNWWIVSSKSTNPSVEVQTAVQLANAIADSNIKNITISGDITNASGFELDLASTGSKTITVNADNTLSLNSGITVNGGTSLDITGGTIKNTGTDPMFTIAANGELTLEAGTYEADTKNYISADASAKIKIKNGVQFKGTYNELKNQIEKHLGTGQKLIDNGDGTCTVTSKPVSVDTPQQLQEALNSPDITEIKISGDINCESDLVISGDKTLDIGNGTLTLSGDGKIKVPEDSSLVISGDGTISKDHGPIFDISGDITIETGRYHSGDGIYFSDETKKENVTIKDGVYFYFISDEQAAAFAEKYLAENQELEKGADGYWKVITSSPTPPTPTPTGGSGGGGCNAGFAALALMGLALFPSRRRK